MDKPRCSQSFIRWPWWFIIFGIVLFWAVVGYLVWTTGCWVYD